MQWKEIQQNWAAFVPVMTSKWTDLDENELLSSEGDQDRVLNHMTDRMGGDRTAAQVAIADWMMGLQPSDAVMDPTRDNERITASGKNLMAEETPLDDDKKFGDDQVAEPPVARAS